VSPIFGSFLAALALGAVHLVAGRLRFLEGIPRSGWLSFAGGVSVAYVFVHLLPELAEHQQTLGGYEGVLWAFVLALVGLVGFYGLERRALTDRAEASEQRAGASQAAAAAIVRAGGTDDVKGDAESMQEASEGGFVVHLGSFALYNVLVGCLLARAESVDGLVPYLVAMALHFVVNDYGLRGHYKRRYRYPGRWVLAGATVAGWALGVSVPLGEEVLAGFHALLAGGVVLNVLKEELPESRRSRFWAFALGAAAYAALLVLFV
jgi:zinc transporter ZupT